jgi:hypothetical protein
MGVSISPTRLASNLADAADTRGFRQGFSHREADAKSLVYLAPPLAVCA